MWKTFRAMLNDDSGATLVEYSLVVALIAVVCIVIIKQLGQNASTVLQSASDSI